MLLYVQTCTDFIVQMSVFDMIGMLLTLRNCTAA